MNTELNTLLRWIAEGARWAQSNPSLFAERITDASLDVFA